MAVKSIERTVGYSEAENSQFGFDLGEANDLYGFETESPDGEPAIWPRGDEGGDDQPAAQGRCRRVPHDW